MKVFLPVALCCLLAGGALAQSRGGGGAGGMRGGGGVGVRGGGGFGRGNFGGTRVGNLGGFRGGIGGIRTFPGFNRGFNFNRFHFGFRSPLTYAFYSWPFAYPGFGYGFGYGLGYYGSYYDPLYAPGYDYAYTPGYQPNVTVVYPQAAQTQPASTTVYVERANPVIREYDEYGQEISPPAASSGGLSPIYLIAFKDGIIRPSAAYWVTGDTLHYVTLQREEKQVSLSAVDRDLSLQLNRERRVPFRLAEK